uniref:Uncharacterized protein LOC117366224 n=1 Tax=Geotrypetes seraphini TaxID=260995 RepID=A0A6P8S8W8_GEOSA|nr:uncharacterized protein LOC117366224 [Geotrypetes seraphini]
MGSHLPPDSLRWTFMTALCLWIWKPGEAKVYISCGAVLNSMERGLILSPGFPNSYDPGSHCVWQFVVPAGYQLVMEIFDFDVFENTSDPTDSFPFSFKRLNTNMPFTEESSFGDLHHSVPTAPLFHHEERWKTLHNRSQDPSFESAEGHLDEIFSDIKIHEAAKQMSEQKWLSQGDSAKDLPNEFPSTAEASVSAHYNTPRQEVSTQDTGQKMINKNKIVHLPGRKERGSKTNEDNDLYIHQPTISEGVMDSATAFLQDSSSSLPLPIDICPHDVLYISDLITFSSRFCGTNSPLNKTMVFGSSVGLVEVIMELITTTDRGRGFAMLFEYKNDTGVTPMDLQRHGENMIILAIITGTIFFALILTTLYMVYRHKIWSKRRSSGFSEQENGIQNAAVDISELQLVVQSWKSDNRSFRDPEAAGNSRGTQGRDPSHQTLTEASSSPSAASASGSDKVFAVLSGEQTNELSSTSCRMQDKNLKRSITSSASVSKWLTDHEMLVRGAKNERIVPNTQRQRTWSVRTFHDLLPPLPQLQSKRCSSWTTNSPFTKLLDSGSCMDAKNWSEESHRPVCSALYSESSSSNVTGQLSQPAQQHQRLSSCQLKKSLFGSPSFGFLTSSNHAVNKQSTIADSYQPENGNFGPDHTLELSRFHTGSSAKSSSPNELTAELESLKPVFIISEENDDQLPLVFAEQLCQTGDTLSLGQGGNQNTAGTKADAQLPSQDFLLGSDTNIPSELGTLTRFPASYSLQHYSNTGGLKSPRSLNSLVILDSSQTRPPI